MAGLFEVFVDAESHFRFRLKAPDGTVVAVSRAFDDKPAAVVGIAAVRECAGTGLITDLGEAGRRNPASSASAAQGQESQRIPAGDIRTRARAIRSAPAPRWTGAA